MNNKKILIYICSYISSFETNVVVKIFKNLLLSGGPLPLQLQKAYVNVFSNDQCEDYLKVQVPTTQIYDSMLCAG